MKKLAFKSIRTRLTFWFLVMTLVPLLIVIIISFEYEKRSMEKDTISKLVAIRNLKVQQLENWINERIGDLRTMSGDYEIRNLENVFGVKNKSPEDIKKIEKAQHLLNRYLENYRDYKEIFIIGCNSGKVEVSTNPNMIGKNKSHDPYFTNTMKSRSIYIKDIYYSKTLNEKGMTISIPISCLSHNGKHIAGILVARINIDKSLRSLFQNRVGLGKTGETLIVNKDGVALNELKWYENAPLNLRISTKPAVDALHGKTDVIITKDYRGKKVLAAYTYIRETGWGFICKQDIHELNIPVHAMLINFLVLLGFTTVIIYFLASFVSKIISKPIVKMNIITRKIKNGDYSVKNIIKSKDELGSLAYSINEMANSIKSHAEIQDGVKDISVTMVGKSSIRIFCSDLLKQLMKITDSNMGAFYILNEEKSEFEHYLSIGTNEKLFNSFNAENSEGEFANAVFNKKISHIRDIPKNSTFTFKTTAGEIIPKEIITIPIITDDTVVAIISLANIHKFSKESCLVIEQSWNALNSSYSNLISNERTRILAENLSKINLKLEAQTEEMQEQTEELQSQSEELQNQNVELETQRKRVEEANRLKSEFLSNMSHELRTPLNSIMALSRVLIMQTKNTLTEEEKKYLEIIERNGKQLLRLINEILDLSKIEAGKMKLNLTSFSLNSMLKNIEDSFLPIIKEKNLDFNMNIMENIPMIYSDESKLHQVLQNIVSNAVKFTEKGEIKIQATLNSNKIYIEVEDTGVGIPQNELKHIFDEFRQVDGSSSRMYEGTGLGLAIAIKMMKIIGGDIKVKSKIKKGSTFIISFPFKYSKNNATGIQISKHNEKNDFYGQENIDEKIETEKENSDVRILIVEDNETAVIQVKSILKNENYVVDVATDGKKALEYLKHTIPDGIILDLMMPNVDGFEVIKEMMKNSLTKEIPILVLTAKDITSKELSKLTANKIYKLIQKGDIDTKKFLAIIKSMLKDKQKSNAELKKNNHGKTKINVLVIEDNQDNLTTIKAILKNKFNIYEAENGKKALNIIAAEKIDVILLDMTLPEMSGEEIVKIIKTSSEFNNIPIIAVTAMAMKNDREKCLEMGCADYVSKPINHIVLINTIEKCLHS